MHRLSHLRYSYILGFLIHSCTIYSKHPRHYFKQFGQKNATKITINLSLVTVCPHLGFSMCTVWLHVHGNINFLLQINWNCVAIKNKNYCNLKLKLQISFTLQLNTQSACQLNRSIHRVHMLRLVIQLFKNKDKLLSCGGI